MSRLACAFEIPVTVTRRVLKLTRRPCHRRLGHPVTDTAREEAHRTNARCDAHRDDRDFGDRFPNLSTQHLHEPGLRHSQVAFVLCSSEADFHKIKTVRTNAMP